MTKFVEPLVERPFSFSDVHEEVFAGRADPVESGFFWDGAEFFFIGGERHPWGPREVAPVFGEVFSIVEICRGLVGIGRHA